MLMILMVVIEQALILNDVIVAIDVVIVAVIIIITLPNTTISHVENVKPDIARTQHIILHVNKINPQFIVLV